MSPNYKGITLTSWQGQILGYCFIPSLSPETLLLDLWLQRSSSIEGCSCASLCLAARTSVKTVNFTRSDTSSHKQQTLPANPETDVWTRGHIKHHRDDKLGAHRYQHISPPAPVRLVCKLPRWPFLTPWAPPIGMSGTLEHRLNFCTAGYVQHGVIMHTCNIFYFHIRFKWFLYSLASFFFLAWNARERRKTCFSQRIFAFGTPIAKPVGEMFCFII